MTHYLGVARLGENKVGLEYRLSTKPSAGEGVLILVES